MNAAALKVNLSWLVKRRLYHSNLNGFNDKKSEIAGYAANPLGRSLSDYQVFEVDITKLTNHCTFKR